MTTHCRTTQIQAYQLVIILTNLFINYLFIYLWLKRWRYGLVVILEVRVSLVGSLLMVWVLLIIMAGLFWWCVRLFLWRGRWCCRVNCFVCWMTTRRWCLMWGRVSLWYCNLLFVMYNCLYCFCSIITYLLCLYINVDSSFDLWFVMIWFYMSVIILLW